MTHKPSISWLFFFSPVKAGKWPVITSRVGQEALTMTILSWTCTSQDSSEEQDFFFLIYFSFICFSYTYFVLPLEWTEFSFLKCNDVMNEKQEEAWILFLCPQSSHCSRWFSKTLVFSSLRCQLVGCLEPRKYILMPRFLNYPKVTSWTYHRVDTGACPEGFSWKSKLLCAVDLERSRRGEMSCCPAVPPGLSGEIAAWGARVSLSKEWAQTLSSDQVPNIKTHKVWQNEPHPPFAVPQLKELETSYT